mgnify:CR=1 FL=1
MMTTNHIAIADGIISVGTFVLSVISLVFGILCLMPAGPFTSINIYLSVFLLIISICGLYKFICSALSLVIICISAMYTRFFKIKKNTTMNDLYYCS